VLPPPGAVPKKWGEQLAQLLLLKLISRLGNTCVSHLFTFTTTQFNESMTVNGHNFSEQSAFAAEPLDVCSPDLSLSASDRPEGAMSDPVHHNADDLTQLLEMLPEPIRQTVKAHPERDRLIEIVLDLGRTPEARFPGNKAIDLSDTPVTRADLDYCVARVGMFSGDNRAGIERTLHRISAIRNRQGEVVGLTCRVGRAIFGTITMIRELVETGQSILLLGRPGVGKTTALREIARVLADELHKRVVIIDTSNEIAGDGDIPHPAIGRARRMQVARPELQHQVMIEAVENHMPEVIVIDEIGTELEALAARTIAERGVQLVGTAHGNRIDNLIKNPTLSDLVGGIQSVTLGDEEAKRRGSQKSVLERKAPPTFDIAVEMLERERWIVHESVADTVDLLLRGRVPNPQVRSLNEMGEVVITHEFPDAPIPPTPPSPSLVANSLANGTKGMANSGSTFVGNFTGNFSGRGGWRTSGQMVPMPTYRRNDLGAGSNHSSGNIKGAASASDAPTMKGDANPEREAIPSIEQMQFDQMLNTSLNSGLEENVAFGRDRRDLRSDYRSDYRSDLALMGPDGEELPLHVYPYAVSRNQLDQIIHTMQLPIVLTKDMDDADAVLALRSHIKNHSKLRHLAKTRQVPIYAIKSNSIPQIVRGLQRMLNLDEPSIEESAELNLSLFARSHGEDEIEALEEARLAVEQIVIPKGQPVELLPRSGKVRKMQHELVEHYRLRSSSFGEEPNRRLRIYPA
jgi:stage III sporulation protein SpoIIIAA